MQTTVPRNITVYQASAWSMTATSESEERARRAAVMRLYGLSPAQEVAIYEAVLDGADEGAEGMPQLVIPGAERIPDREIAERRMCGAMQAKARQRPADHGLFDIGARDQGDLFA
jgi:hypothetical protein